MNAISRCFSIQPITRVDAGVMSSRDGLLSIERAKTLRFLYCKSRSLSTNLMRRFLVSYLLQEQMLWQLIGLLSTNLLCFKYDE